MDSHTEKFTGARPFHANLAWNKIVRPQHVGYGRIAVDDLEAHTATFLESVRHRFDADIKSVNFAEFDRLWIGMGVIRLHLGAFLRVERTMRGTEPAFRDPEIGGIEILGTILGRLRHLFRKLDKEVHVVAGRRSIEHELDGSGDFEVAV